MCMPFVMVVMRSCPKLKEEQRQEREHKGLDTSNEYLERDKDDVGNSR